ncbi:late embryogenesis abundant protein [Prunus yedoensis var. nudiflora]|uniref:Late embryogenesis abundant protein n=1 Tax=Prunus yedoensis var. nudiflora TaxID=2094558 RepID=A0A314UIL5_PRUYE|nr:late embryogenesis abundant protein [Prunus yedoensis var. nudiflora]
MAEQESQVWPLAPSRLFRRSDEENPTFKAIRRERSNKCFVYVFAAIVLQSILILVFALVVLRVKSPGFNLSSVAVKNLKHTTSPTSLNATLATELVIKNKNFGEYKFEGSSASLWYGGFKVGEAKIGNGSVKARGTKRVSLSIEVKSNRLPQEAKNGFEGEMNSGYLKISSYAKLSGKVNLMKKIKTRKTIDTNCTMVVVLKSRTVKDLVCR